MVLQMESGAWSFVLQGNTPGCGFGDSSGALGFFCKVGGGGSGKRLESSSCLEPTLGVLPGRSSL